MDSHFRDYSEDLIDTEKLSAFNVVESFCDQCGDLTPHHIEELRPQTNEHQDLDEMVLVAPISIHECVICREDEETRIDL